MSWRALTEYELKQLFAQSATLSWSGNSNQIYTPLVELHKEGLVSVEVQLQEARPARKVYTITEKGEAVLKSWMLSTPKAPLQKNAFLLQLAWADHLIQRLVKTLSHSKVNTEVKEERGFPFPKLSRSLGILSQLFRQERYVLRRCF